MTNISNIVSKATKYSGTGKGKGGEAGHMKKWGGNAVRYYGGNGSKRHPDCFTCPFPADDCRW